MSQVQAIIKATVIILALVASHANASVFKNSRFVEITTDVLNLTVDLVGADLSTANAQQITVQSGLIAQVGIVPNHLATYQSTVSSASLQVGQNALEVPFTWTDAIGITVRKIYRFERGSFAVRLRYEISNESSTPITLFQYSQIQSRFGDVNASFFYSKGNQFVKIVPSDFIDNPLKTSTVGGWFGLLKNKLFVSWIPANELNQYTSVLLPAAANKPSAYLIRQSSAPRVLAPSASLALRSTLYVGPFPNWLTATQGVERVR